MTKAERLSLFKQISAARKAEKDSIARGHAGEPKNVDAIINEADQAENVYKVLKRIPGKNAGQATEKVGRKVQGFRHIAELTTERAKHKSGSKEYHAANNNLQREVADYIERNDPQGFARMYSTWNPDAGRMEPGAGGSLDASMIPVIASMGKERSYPSGSRRDIGLNASPEEMVGIAEASGRTDILDKFNAGDKSAFAGSGWLTVPGINRMRRTYPGDPNKGNFRPSDYQKRFEGIPGKLGPYEDFDPTDLAPPVPTQEKFRSRYKEAMNRERRIHDAFLVGPRQTPELVGPPSPNPTPYDPFSDPEYITSVSEAIAGYGVPVIRGLREQANMASELNAEGMLMNVRGDHRGILAGDGLNNIASTRNVRASDLVSDSEDGGISGVVRQSNDIDQWHQNRAIVGADNAVEDLVEKVGPRYREWAEQWVQNNPDRIVQLGSRDRVSQAAISDWINEISQGDNIVAEGSPFATNYNHFDEKTASVRSYPPDQVPPRLRADQIRQAKGLSDEALNSIASGTLEESLADTIRLGVRLGSENDIKKARADFNMFGDAADANDQLQQENLRIARDLMSRNEPVPDEILNNLPITVQGEEPTYFGAARAQQMVTAAQYQSMIDNYKKVYGVDPDEAVSRSVPLSDEEQAMQIINRNEMGENDKYAQQVRVFGSPYENFKASVNSARKVSGNATDIDHADWGHVKKSDLMQDGSVALIEKVAYTPGVDDAKIDTKNDDGSHNALVLTIDINDPDKGRLLSDSDGDYVESQLLEDGYTAAFDSINGTFEIVKENGRTSDEWLRSIRNSILDKTGISVDSGDLGRLRLDLGRVHTPEAQQYSANISQRQEEKEVTVTPGIRRRKARA